MRLMIAASLLISLSACATTQVEMAHMPVEILRAEGEAPRMGDVTLRAGNDAREAPFSFTVYFESDGERLGEIRSVNWSVTLDHYCRDRNSWVQSILTGPEGQVWRGYRVGVPAGPDRVQWWSSGSSRATGPNAFATPGLEDAIAAGGRFTIAIEDDEGRRWDEMAIDTLTPKQRMRLFEANRTKVAAAPRDMPVADREMLMVASPPQVDIPNPPRPCPRD